jgi:HIRAN domain
VLLGCEKGLYRGLSDGGIGLRKFTIAPETVQPLEWDRLFYVNLDVYWRKSDCPDVCRFGEHCNAATRDLVDPCAFADHNKSKRDSHREVSFQIHIDHLYEPSFKMSRIGKRPASFVDLTSDDENQPPQRKQARTKQHPDPQPPSSQSLNTRDAWGDVNEENELIDLSQDIDEGFGWTCVGAIDDKIVGIRYYNGLATAGEQVMIKREPGNPYDRNAIRIDNVQGAQIGHIPRNLAAKLAPYLVSTSRASYWTKTNLL